MCWHRWGEGASWPPGSAAAAAWATCMLPCVPPPWVVSFAPLHQRLLLSLACEGAWCPSRLCPRAPAPVQLLEQRDAAKLEVFFKSYGASEAAAMCILLATAGPPQVWWCWEGKGGHAAHRPRLTKAALCLLCCTACRLRQRRLVAVWMRHGSCCHPCLLRPCPDEPRKRGVVTVSGSGPRSPARQRCPRPQVSATVVSQAKAALDNPRLCGEPQLRDTADGAVAAAPAFGAGADDGLGGCHGRRRGDCKEGAQAWTAARPALRPSPDLPPFSAPPV